MFKDNLEEHLAVTENQIYHEKKIIARKLVLFAILRLNVIFCKHKYKNYVAE